MLLILTHELILPSSHIPASSYTTICSTSVVQSCNRVLETATASGRHKTGLFFVVTCLILHIGRKNLQLLSTFSQGKEHVQCVHVTLPSFYFHGSNLTSAEHGKICFWVWGSTSSTGGGTRHAGSQRYSHVTHRGAELEQMCHMQWHPKPQALRYKEPETGPWN